jgi:hypothetical protein
MAAELLDVDCEDLTYIPIDVRVHGNSEAIDHSSV